MRRRLERERPRQVVRVFGQNAARGLVTYYTLFVIDISGRAVRIAGTTTNPTAAWMTQIARNLTDCVDGFLTGKRYLILDRDALYAPVFLAMLRDAGIEVVRTAYRAPNMNAFAERFVRSIKSECFVLAWRELWRSPRGPSTRPSQSGYKQTNAARILGLSRPTLQAKMQRYGIRRETSIRDDSCRPMFQAVNRPGTRTLA